MFSFKKRFSLAPVMIGLLSAQAVAADGPNKGLEEILVTADKLQARSASDTPFAISVIGGDEIENKGFTQTSELLRQTPGVFADQIGGGTQSVSIRGVGNVNSADPTVGFYLDDQPFVIPQFNILPDLNPYDLSHVEVLRGPQGTLYGASSLGGTVRVVTQDPVHNEFSAKVTFGYSSTKDGGDNYKAQGAVNIPLIDDVLSMRLVASDIDREGYIDLPLTGEEDFNDSEDKSYRVKLRYTPNDTVELKLSHWQVNQNQSTDFSNEDFEFSPFVLLLDPATFLPTGNTQALTGEQLRTHLDYDLTSLSGSFDWGEYSLYATASHMELDQLINGIYASATPFGIVSDFKMDSMEIRLSHVGDSPLSWTLGAFYNDNDGTAPYFLNTFFDTTPVTSGSFVISDQLRTSEQWAVFGELHYDLIPDTLVLTLGARYFEDKRTEEEGSTTTPTYFNLVAGGFDTKRSDTFDATTGRINLSYTPNDNSLYYLNIAEGFRSGNIQCGACVVGGIGPDKTEPEELISYEVGSKVQFMDNTLALDVALYYWEWDEIQLALLDFAPDGTPANFYANVGKASAVGLDLGLKYMGVEGLTLALAGNVNESEYDDDLPRAGISKGDQIEMSSEYSVTLSADYEWAIADGLTGTVYAAYTKADAVPTYNVFAPPLYSDGIDLMSARAGVIAENWSLMLTAENLLDDDGIRNQQFVTNLLGGAPYYQSPQTLGLEFTYQF